MPDSFHDFFKGLSELSLDKINPFSNTNTIVSGIDPLATPEDPYHSTLNVTINLPLREVDSLSQPTLRKR